mmetsp:Transcript_130/g.460  ORF Transcript_130/g.460 Transcript_130/m.460 type:complete len:140 (-) Transcript_130:333-752(-)
MLHRTFRRVSTHDLVVPFSVGEFVADLVSSEGGRVDFPTVTDICERIEQDPCQVDGVARVLVHSLDTSKGSACHLKALTVAHELLYDKDARHALLLEPGLVKTLEGIKNGRLQDPAAEVSYVLASEILRQLATDEAFEL